MVKRTFRNQMRRAAARRVLLLALIICGGSFAVAQNGGPADPVDPWFGTFSIIAFDPATGDLGVGVQSRAFGAGAAVPYAKPGVGAVATQASANRSYGPKAIALLEQGLSPDEVVKRITGEDDGRDTRQVAVIDAKGRSAVYTGRRVIERNSDPKDLVHLGGYAGHVSGTSYSVQGNTLASVDVVKAMAAAYERSKGAMGERLMDALDAGQAKAAIHAACSQRGSSWYGHSRRDRRAPWNGSSTSASTITRIPSRNCGGCFT